MNKIDNTMKNIKLQECPNCLGNKEMFDPDVDKMVNCTFCNGEGKVSEDKADLYDPISFETGLSQEDYMIENIKEDEEI